MLNCTSHRGALKPCMSQKVAKRPAIFCLESQNYLGWKKPLRSLSLIINLIPSCLPLDHIPKYDLGEETNPHLVAASFQVVLESDKVPSFFQATQLQLLQLLLLRFVLL